MINLGVVWLELYNYGRFDEVHIVYLLDPFYLMPFQLFLFRYIDISLLKDPTFIAMCLSVTLMSTGCPYMLYFLPVYAISAGELFVENFSIFKNLECNEIDDTSYSVC